MDIYSVGGAVRDRLLGFPVKDHDWVIVGATPEQLLTQGFSQVGKDFPVFLHPETKEEYALARTERKLGKGYAGFTCYAAADVTLEQDLLRRDLTINAMAEDADGNIYDPYNGQTDLSDKLLRHVSDAFCEDPLRILRIARFHARYAHLGFSIADDTMVLLQSMVTTGEVEHLVSERVWQETIRALSEKSPQIYFQTLRECGALAVIMPEFDALFGVPQPEAHHPEIDTGVHVLMALEQVCALSDDLPPRFAILCHDFGKGKTKPEDWPRHIAHEATGLNPIKKLCQRLTVPNEYRELALITCEYHTHIHRAVELKAKTVVKVLDATDAFRRPERFQQFLLACEADARGRLGLELRPYPQRLFFQRALLQCQEVKAKDFIAQGLKGKEIATAISAERVNRVAQIERQ
ncbi:Multifunctional CCA protein [Sinobacterium norvegicum]|uniref:Multifunctional CCA protein n=1 Tax=Sinobacterium norvegicum TaxID=1641715 RepID=A0ABN8EGT9_9GAMM|nr:multifunctional CCA addition/repair protein [Sinobacterium norvegicum]CAH0991486.1 Multifunctional CCA protein [Sinobacterium norvegicum]